MDAGTWMKVIVDGHIGIPQNEFTNTWTFECLSASDPNSLQNIGLYIVQSMVDNFYLPLTGWTAPETTITHVALRDYANDAEGYDWVGDIQIGTAAGGALPPFVTYSVQLQRANYAMHNGRKGLPGPIISALDANGGLNSTARDFINNTIDSWAETWNVEAGLADYAFALRIVREPATPNTNPTVWSAITGAVVKGFGTQNTRKN